jgi:ribosomal protein S18 acetylase RimI-like enzyme
MNVIPHTVRPASPEDAARLAAIHVRSWQVGYRGLLPEKYLDRLDPADRVERWRRILLDTDWSRGGVLVLAADGVLADDAGLVGFAGFGPSRDADADPAQVGEIAAIYLLPEVWGGGLGRQLMAAAVALLAGAGYAQATLWVLDSNVRARRFYASCGWGEDGASRRDETLGFPITKVRFRRPLP